MSIGTPVLSLHGVQIGSTTCLDLSFYPGVTALLGRGGAGKTTLLEIAAGVRKVGGVTIRKRGSCVLVPESPTPKRGTVLGTLRTQLRRATSVGTCDVASAIQKSGFLDSDRLANLLEIFELWDVRTAPITLLSRSQAAAFALATAIAVPPPIVMVDCTLDCLPGPIQKRVQRELMRLSRGNVSVVLATRRAELAERAERVIILEGGKLLADGEPSRLVAEVLEDEIVVDTTDPAGLRSMVEPWMVRVEETPDGIRLTTPSGMERAARLLLEGYGTVRAVLLRPASLEEAWQRVIELKSG